MDEVGRLAASAGDARLGVELREEGAAQLIGRHDIQPAVLDDRRDKGHCVEKLLHAGPHFLTFRRSPGPGVLPRSGVGCTDQVEEMRALGVVQLQRPADPFEDSFRRTLGFSPFPTELDVHRDAEPVNS